jgi:hypothetical protein
MTGGNYSLDGGFWAIIAAEQTAGAPLLTITRTATNTVVVSWPFPSTGFVLQETSTLLAPNWVASTDPVSTDGARNFITISHPAGSRFYRLKK